MKKITFLLCMVICVLQVNAQTPQYVSTEPMNRNVLIEELTGKNCGWCPAGQKDVNDFIKNNPGRVFAINIHSENAGNLSPKTYPNLNTLKGDDIYKVYTAGSLPAAMINRTTETAEPWDTDTWNLMVKQQLNQNAECNIAGQVSINPDTRLARITVEVYYTSDSKVDVNYLTIVMLQNNILGDQSGSEKNPEQIVNDKYNHMHVFRNTITEKWGNEISPTTSGTLIKKTFKYTIPETIGDPNGVDVVLEDLHFLAFVTEKRESGINTFPVLNVCELKEAEQETPVEDIEEYSYNVYPNPVENEIYIEMIEPIEELVIYNINGQQTAVDFQQTSSTRSVINVSNLNPGLYFIRVNNKVQKFIKQ